MWMFVVRDGSQLATTTRNSYVVRNELYGWFPMILFTHDDKESDKKHIVLVGCEKTLTELFVHRNCCLYRVSSENL